MEEGCVLHRTRGMRASKHARAKECLKPWGGSLEICKTFIGLEYIAASGKPKLPTKKISLFASASSMLKWKPQDTTLLVTSKNYCVNSLQIGCHTEERIVNFLWLTQCLAKYSATVLTKTGTASVERVRELNEGVTLMHGDACRETEKQLITTLRLVKFSSRM